jgi:MYXO-CTERM domain-containing protein
MPPYANTVVGMTSDGGAVYASEPTASAEVGIDQDSAAAPANKNATSSSGSSSSDSGDSGGCSVAASGRSGQAGLGFVLLGLAGLLGRRRRR